MSAGYTTLVTHPQGFKASLIGLKSITGSKTYVVVKGAGRLN